MLSSCINQARSYHRQMNQAQYYLLLIKTNVHPPQHAFTLPSTLDCNDDLQYLLKYLLWFYCSWIVVALVIGWTSLRIMYLSVEPLEDTGIFDPNARVLTHSIRLAVVAGRAKIPREVQKNLYEQISVL